MRITPHDTVCFTFKGLFYFLFLSCSVRFNGRNMCNTYSNTYQQFCIKYLIQRVNVSEIKVAISEFGLWMSILILLNHYIFVEVIRCLHDNKRFGSQ